MLIHWLFFSFLGVRPDDEKKHEMRTRPHRRGSLTPPARMLLALAVATGVAGCAGVPKESVELSLTLGRDLAEVHKAHRALADSYFDRMEKDVRTFIDETYRPYIIAHAIEDMDLLGELDRARAPAAEIDPLSLMEVFVEETVAQITTYQDSLLTPIRQQRVELTRAIDDAYNRLRDANAVVTGHLASVRKVHDAQDDLLAAAGLEGMRERTLRATADLSAGIADILQRAKGAEELIDGLPRSIRALVGDSTSIRQPPGG